MSVKVEVCFFNSFLLKRMANPDAGSSSQSNYGFDYWPSLPWADEINYPIFDPSDSETNFYVEESRIRGGYNNSFTQIGPRAFLSEEDDDLKVRSSSLIYSGVFNSRTGVNNTNVFPIGEDITRTVDPGKGTIQLIHARDTDLTVFQENKVSRALIDKDAIYSAEGGGTVTTSQNVIGTVTPYEGDYGISQNPESFAYYGFRRYFADANRGAILRLSRDGLTEISGYGMYDFFRDELGKILNDNQLFSVSGEVYTENTLDSNQFYVTSDYLDSIELGMDVELASGQPGTPIVVDIETSPIPKTLIITVSIDVAVDTGAANAETCLFSKWVKDKVVGGFDINNKNYINSIQKHLSTPDAIDDYKTISFDDDIRGWVSFSKYKPLFMGSIKSNYYSFTGAQSWLHYSNNLRNSFYGLTPEPSSITFIFNVSPSSKKNFNTINYEGSNGWEMKNLTSSEQGFDIQNNVEREFTDNSDTILSYKEGYYTDPITSQPKHAGFDRKENLYVANIVQKITNNNTADPNFYPIRPGEVISGNKMTGLKGYYLTAKIQTDQSTDPFNFKEIFTIGTTYTISS